MSLMSTPSMVHCIDTCFEYLDSFVGFFSLRFVNYGCGASRVLISVT
jgi:hypothetical protein